MVNGGMNGGPSHLTGLLPGLSLSLMLHCVVFHFMFNSVILSFHVPHDVCSVSAGREWDVLVCGGLWHSGHAARRLSR